MNTKEIEIYKNMLGMSDEMLLIDEISSNHENYLIVKLEEYDLTYLQFKVMLAIEFDSDISQKELAEIFSMNESGITRLISKIQNKEFLTTTKSSSNKRRKEMKLTKKGLDILADLRIYEDKWNDNFKSNLRNDEIIELNKLLKKAKSRRTRTTIFGTDYQIKRIKD